MIGLVKQKFSEFQDRWTKKIIHRRKEEEEEEKEKEEEERGELHQAEIQVHTRNVELWERC